jgi:hypothetical protein
MSASRNLARILIDLFVIDHSCWCLCGSGFVWRFLGSNAAGGVLVGLWQGLVGSPRLSHKTQDLTKFSPLVVTRLIKTIL